MPSPKDISLIRAVSVLVGLLVLFIGIFFFIRKEPPRDHRIQESIIRHIRGSVEWYCEQGIFPPSIEMIEKAGVLNIPETFPTYSLKEFHLAVEESSAGRYVIVATGPGADDPTTNLRAFSVQKETKKTSYGHVRHSAFPRGYLAVISVMDGCKLHAKTVIIGTDPMR